MAEVYGTTEKIWGEELAPSVVVSAGWRDANAIGVKASKLKTFWGVRNQAFGRFDNLLALKDENESTGLESAVANNAKTLFSLSHFMVSSSIPQRTVAIGGQGPTARRRAGKSERAVYSMWQRINDDRLLSGEETWQYAMAYWMCLYGWYASLAVTTIGPDGEPDFVAVPYDPADCFPEFSGPFGLGSFAHIYESTLGEVQDKAEVLGATLNLSGDRTLGVTLTDYWERVRGQVVNCTLVQGANVTGSYMFLKEPEVVPGLKQIPILCGPCGGTPSRSKRKNWMSVPGSVLSENERVYKDFNKWLSFLSQLNREHAQAPYLAKNLHIEEEQIRPTDIRDSGAIIESDDPEADLRRIDPGRSPLDVFRLLTVFSSMEQRGGFPESAYGNLMIELSGFGISQLLQAAERRVGPQISKLMYLDAYIGGRWLQDFRDNEFSDITIEGFEGGNLRKSFIEDFTRGDVPKKFRISTHIPIRMGSDLMSRMSVVRQALGGQEQVLDLFTALDEILQMEDPTLIMDRISEDRARTMSEPLRLAVNLKMQADDLRASRKPGSREAADMLDQFAETMIQQAQQATGAQPRQRIGPEALPQEARGQSPDQVRAQLRMGPPPNLTAQEQAAGVTQ